MILCLIIKTTILLGCVKIQLEHENAKVETKIVSIHCKTAPEIGNTNFTKTSSFTYPKITKYFSGHQNQFGHKSSMSGT